MQSKKGISILFIMIVFIMILSANKCWTQDPIPPPAPPIDPTPLERPVPLSIIKIDTNLVLLNVIADTLESYQFNLVRRDEREQLIEAKRMDAPGSKDHDKVLIWLEEDFQEPQKYIKIFCQYGRYLLIWDEVKRIKIDAEEETERIGKLKTAIISISN